MLIYHFAKASMLAARASGASIIDQWCQNNDVMYPALTFADFNSTLRWVPVGDI